MNSLFLEVVNKHAPVKQHKVKKSRQTDWLSPEILDGTCIKQRNKCNKINGKIDEYKFLRDKVSAIIKSANKEVWHLSSLKVYHRESFRRFGRMQILNRLTSLVQKQDVTLSKIIEKWIHLNFMTYLNNHKLLHQKQSGFRTGHSTESALIIMIDSWSKAVNEG